MEKEKVNEKVVLHKTHNAETIEIRNPSEELLAFMMDLENRKKARLEKHRRENTNVVYEKI